MLEIISAGFGGQGVLTLGLIVAKVSSDNGKEVSWIPSYGSEMRGGTANCNVKISDEEIGSPFVKDIDVLIAMNGPSIDKFEDMIKPNGLLMVNSSLIDGREYRDDIRVIQVAATDIAIEAKNSRGANIVMLGAFAKNTDLLEKDVFADGVDKFFKDKGIENNLNRLCFEKGYELGKAKEAN